MKKNATLTALAGGLGKTSSLVVAAGATYENAGDNAAGGIDVAETGTLLLTSGTLTLDMASGEEGTIAGAIEGAGNLTVSAGDVSVSGANSDYSGATTVTAGGTIAADDIDALGTGTINADDGTIAFTLGTPASGTGYTLDNAVAGGKNGTIRVDLSAAAGTKFAFSSTEESSFSGVLHLIGADFTLDAAATANQSVADGATLVLGDGAALHVSSSVIDPTHDFHDRYVSGLVLEKGSTVSFGGLVYNPNSNNKTYGGQLNLSGGELDLSRLDEGEKALIHLEEGATNYLGDGAELLVADDTAQINIFENAGGIVLRADSSDLNDYLALDVDDSSNPQTISQQIEEGGEYVEVAEVTREFGGFGSAEHAADGGTHTDVYLEYTVTNLNLKYTGDGNGLHVANTSGATGDEADLKMQVTGEGNIVFAGGEIVMGAAGGEANTYTGATYVNAGQVTAAKSGAFGETKYLAVAKNAAVDFAGFDQTVKTIASAGSLASTARATLTIGADDAEVRSSYVNGENAGLHADVNLLGSGHTLTINDGAALGDGTLTLHGNALVIAGAGSADAYDRLTNKSIEGTGTITASGSRIVIDHANGFQGTWTAEAGTTVTADAADLVFDASAEDISVAEIIGEDSTVAIGENVAATMIENVGWTLRNDVSGTGELFLSAGGRGNEFSFAASGDGSGTITGFTGTYHLSDLTLTLNDTTSDLAGDIVLEDGATATVGTGEWTLNKVAVDAGGRLDFAGNLAPGRYDEEVTDDNQTALNAESHLSVDSLHLAAGAQIAVDLTGLTVDPSDKPGENVQLTAQDVLSEDSGSLLTVLATSKTEIENNGAVLVDPEGNAIDDTDQVKVDIVSQPEGGVDAIGTYDYGLETSDDGTELGIAYKLTEVDLQSGRTLALSAAEGTGALKDNTLTAKLTGEGSLQITSGYVVLNNGSNDYQGATTVDAGATLEAAAGSLGENGLVAAGTYVNAGDNTTTTAVVSENGTFTLNEGTTFTLNGTEGASEIAGDITGSGSLVVEDGASLAVTSGNAGYTGNTTVRGAGAVTASAADALGTETTITVADEASQYVLDKVNGDVANSFAGKGTVGLAGSIVEFIGSNAGFTGTFALEGSAMTVSSAAALGSGNVLGIAPQTGEAENTLTLSFAENADLATVIAGAVDAEKTGEGVISLESYAADGTFTVSAGGVNFTTFGTEDTESALVIADGTSSSVKASSVLESLTLAGAESVFTVGGTASDHASAPISVLVRGETAVGGGTLNLGVDAGDSLTSGMIGNVLTTEDFSIEGGTINVNGLLDSDGWTVDRLVVNGTGEGSGTIFVNLLGEASGGAGADAWLVQAGESGDLSGLDLTLGNDDGIIDAGTYEWHLLEAENGAGYYLHAFNKGTGDIDGSEIREPAAGAQAALLMASQTAFDLSLHDHIGNTPYVDQLTGERKLTSLWMIQRGDWGEWNDMSGQLATDGKVHTTTIGGDLKSWVADSGCHVHLGLLGAYANADYDVESSLDNRKATGQFTGWSVGGYAAFKPAGMDGGFGSIQVRWNRFDNEAGLAGEKTYDYKSDGFSIQGELGWTKTLSAFRTFGGKTGFWRIEPHVRAHWNGVSSDAATDSRGRTYEVDGEGNILVRVGFRTTLDVTHSASPKFGDPSVRAYFEANYLRNTKEASVTMTNEYRTSTVDYDNSDMAEFRFGMEAQFNEHMHLWGELHRVTGDDDYESTGAMVGFKYLW